MSSLFFGLLHKNATAFEPWMICLSDCWWDERLHFEIFSGVVLGRLPHIPPPVRNTRLDTWKPHCPPEPVITWKECSLTTGHFRACFCSLTYVALHTLKFIRIECSIHLWFYNAVINTRRCYGVNNIPVCTGFILTSIYNIVDFVVMHCFKNTEQLFLLT